MVSVNEIGNPEEIPKDILKAIFDKQRILAQKYVDIEEMGDLLETTATNLDTVEGQIWLKDFLYRIIEEVGESYEIIFEHLDPDKGFDSLTDLQKTHYSEELIDALHFFVELCIIAGYEHTDFKPLKECGLYVVNNDKNNPEEYAIRHWYIVQYLTFAGNKLRNKKWKKTHVLTDRKIFFEHIEEAFDSLIHALRVVGNTDEDIYMMYFKKNKVNQFRQRSNY